MKKNLIWLLLLIPAISNAQTAGFQLLNIGPSAAELSLSEATVATPFGATSIYSNPALLAKADRPSISLGYTSWIDDSNNLFGGINLVRGNRAMAFAFYTSGVSGFEQRNGPGESNGDFSIQYVSIAGAYAYDFGLFAIGVTGQYLNEDVYPFRANGFAVNAGIVSSAIDERIRIGAALTNAGEMEKLDQRATELPTKFTTGVSIDVLEFVHWQSPDLPILATVMADYVIPMHPQTDELDEINPENNYFNFGLNLLISEIVEVRAGFKTSDNVRPISFGVGFIADKVRFNYALVPFNTGFGTVHSIGLTYQL
ncbi:MAG: PorV/PorQ family protein [Balneolaceae bacterium]|nr:PorV/PorQ family protein [Balneolaceae bacterium]